MPKKYGICLSLTELPYHDPMYALSWYLDPLSFPALGLLGCLPSKYSGSGPEGSTAGLIKSARQKWQTSAHIYGITPRDVLVRVDKHVPCSLQSTAQRGSITRARWCSQTQLVHAPCARTWCRSAPVDIPIKSITAVVATAHSTNPRRSQVPPGVYAP